MPPTGHRSTEAVEDLVSACRLTKDAIERRGGIEGPHRHAFSKLTSALKRADRDLESGRPDAETVRKMVEACKTTQTSFDRFPGSLYDAQHDAMTRALRSFLSPGRQADDHDAPSARAPSRS